jgi:CBS domain-containing protein
MNSRHRTVEDLMTHEVVRARLQTPFKDLAAMFAEHGITAVPVVDDQDRAIGVVSEADLVRHEAAQHDPYGREPDGPGVPRPDGSGIRRGRRKGEEETAGQLMTAPAVVGRPYWNVVEAARAMDRHRVKRLPVVDENGRLIGIVSRADLMRVFLRGDDAIREEIVREVLGRVLAVQPGEVQVTVAEGVVTLHGRITRRRLGPVLVRLCRGVDGVVSVHDRLDKPPGDAVPGVPWEGRAGPRPRPERADPQRGVTDAEGGGGAGRPR